MTYCNKLLLTLSCACFIAPLAAETIVRGPYLQCATQTSITIQWRTDEPSIGRVAYIPAQGKATIAYAHETEPVTDHIVQLQNLTADTQYRYDIVPNGKDIKTIPSNVTNNFVTAPDKIDRPIRIWALGDCGTGNDSQRSVRDSFYAVNGGPRTDVVLLLGDNAYNKGTDPEYQKGIFNIYNDSMNQTVYWSTIGNHDMYNSKKPSEEEATIPYFKIFTNPTAGEAGGVASGTEKYYSFDYGPVHFICLDSMVSDRSAKSAQAVWLEKDLAQVKAPWMIAFWHHPPYSKGSHDSDKEKNLVEMRENFLPILEKHGVDMVLGGHSHCYERSYLLDGHYGKSDTLTPAMIKDKGDGNPDKPYQKENGPNNGAIYIVTGSAGKVSGGKLDHPAMFISLKELGSLVLDVTPTSLTGRMIAPEQKMRDAFVLKKNSK